MRAESWVGVYEPRPFEVRGGLRAVGASRYSNTGGIITSKRAAVGGTAAQLRVIAVEYLRGGRSVRFPVMYGLLLLAGTLDVVITSLALYLGGSELNALAALVLSAFGIPGLVSLKFAGIYLFILICEAAALRRAGVAPLLVGVAIALNLCAVSVGAAGLVEYFCAVDIDLVQRSVAALDDDIMLI